MVPRERHRLIQEQERYNEGEPPSSWSRWWQWKWAEFLGYLSLFTTMTTCILLVTAYIQVFVYLDPRSLDEWAVTTFVVYGCALGLSVYCAAIARPPPYDLGGRIAWCRRFARNAFFPVLFFWNIPRGLWWIVSELFS